MDIKTFIKDLLNNDIKLERSKGVFNFVLKNIESKKIKLPESILVNDFDDLTLAKKKTVLREILNFLEDVEKIKEKFNKTHQTSSRIKGLIKDFDKSIHDILKLNKKEKEVLSKLNIETILDLVYYFPIRYENRKICEKSLNFYIDKRCCFLVKIEKLKFDPKQKYSLSVICVKEGSFKESLELKFNFKDSRFINIFQKGERKVVCGILKEFNSLKYMVHPELFNENSLDVNKIVPIYSARIREDERETLSLKRKRAFLLKLYGKLESYLTKAPEFLPEDILLKNELCSFDKAISFVHFPKEEENIKIGENRFLYEELFIYSLLMALRRKKINSYTSLSLDIDIDLTINEFERAFGKNLTNAQKKAIREILTDMKSQKPMNRLVQGDVGSGKTAVAMCSMYAAFKNSLQSVLMAPTEILALQHYKNIKDILGRLGVKVALLRGSMSKKEKESVYRLANIGEIDIVIGTHALIEDKLKFKKLGLVVIDEQHRFGVAQRQKLIEKAEGYLPHTLFMSATPIPRTIAISLFGDMDISIIDELPPGRKPVRTRVLYSDRKSDLEFLYNHVNSELSKGRKIYVVYPLIEESQKSSLKSAKEEFKKWSSLFKDKKVLLLHGKLSDDEKQAIMEEFRESGDILVSTTVIEVGVDVGSASTIIIENPERFGLSQLHQLRGRVGRGNLEGYCFLVMPHGALNNKDYENAIKRISVLVKTNDGFIIAQEDLKIRGPGEVLGISQSGYFGFKLANLGDEKHVSILQKALKDANYVVENKLINENLLYVLKRYKSNFVEEEKTVLG